MRYILSSIVIITAAGAFSAASGSQGAASLRLPEDNGTVLGAVEPSAYDFQKFDFNALGLPDTPMPVKTADAELELDEGKAVIIDAGSGKIIYTKDHESPAPIASITKIATALVFLDHNPGWESEHAIRPEDRVEGGREYFFTGDVVTAKNLFVSSLTASANTAAKALVRITGLGQEQYIEEMNAKMQALGLPNTSFVDPVGLSSKNISTPIEIAKLLRLALKEKAISDALLLEKYEFKTKGGRIKIVYNTNRLLSEYPRNTISFLGGKTGYTEAANYCFAGMFANSEGEDIITVFLGGTTPESRFANTSMMAEWAYQNHEWR